MFPPIEDAVLQNNPKFAALHKTLTTRVLNPDGSSKSLAAADRDATAEILHAHRIRATKSEILRASVLSLPLTQLAPPLPPDLLELIVLLSLTLSGPLPAAARALLAASTPYRALQQHLPRISGLLSANLHRQGLALARLLHPTTNPSFLHRAIPRIPAALAAQTAALAAHAAALEAARLALAPRAAAVLERYRAATERAVRALEQHKHGQLAREATARSELLRAEAKHAELSASITYVTARNALYTPEVGCALANYKEHLRDARARLRQRQKDAERELERYGVGREEKEKVMKEIARVYGEIGRQIREVKRDVERLKGA